MVNKAEEEKKLRKKKDKEWSIEVKTKFNNKCAFCEAIRYIQAHHIIPREIKEFRYEILNGIALCPKNHKWGFESAHRNPLLFFMKMEELYPEQLKRLKMKYKKYLENEKQNNIK